MSRDEFSRYDRHQSLELDDVSARCFPRAFHVILHGLPACLSLEARPPLNFGLMAFPLFPLSKRCIAESKKRKKSWSINMSDQFHRLSFTASRGIFYPIAHHVLLRSAPNRELLERTC